MSGWPSCIEALSVLLPSVGFMEFFFKCRKTHRPSCPPSSFRTMKANVWKNFCVKDVLCPLWKWVGVHLHPDSHMLVCRGGQWAHVAALTILTCPTLPLQVALAAPLRSVVLTTRNKVCALFVNASMLCFLSCPPAPLKAWSHLKKYQPYFQ